MASGEAGSGAQGAGTRVQVNQEDDDEAAIDGALNECPQSIVAVSPRTGRQLYVSGEADDDQELVVRINDFFDADSPVLAKSSDKSESATAVLPELRECSPSSPANQQLSLL